ncbi:MAG: tetratricopeptide repeat protein [Deltaproteobacteria bacterium]|nr:tetratricopeptide repeat protein [Deltaproteobacteria bacterium]
METNSPLDDGVNRPQAPESVNETANENAGPAESGSGGSQPQSSRLLITGGLVVLLGLVWFAWSTVFPGGFHLDDLPNITKNKRLAAVVQGKGSIQSYALQSPAKYRPLPYVTFALNAKQLSMKGRKVEWKAEPFLKTNIGIHMAAAVMVFLLLRTLLRVHAPGWTPLVRDGSALLGAAMWALNPVQTAAVSYTVQRMALMATLFIVICLWSWVRWRESGKIVFAVTALAAFTLGMASKEIAATAVLVIVLYEWLLRPERKLCAAGYTLITVMAAAPAVLFYFYMQASPVHWASAGDPLANRDYNSVERVMTQGRVLWHYVSLWLAPLLGRLHLEYAVPVSRGLLDPATTVLAWLAWAGAVAGAIALRRRSPLAAFGVLSFLAFASVESSFLNLVMAFQYRLYLPSLALAGLVAGAAGWFVSRQGRSPALLAVAAVAILAFYVPVAQARNREWSSSIGLLTADIGRVPLGARSYYNLARKIDKKGDQEQKLSLLEKALELDYGVDACLEAASVRSRKPGMVERGEKMFQTCEERYGLSTGLLLNWGGFYKNAGDEAAARARYQRGLDLDPEEARLHANYGSSLYREGRMDEAEERLHHALSLNPRLASAHVSLGMLYFRKGEDEKANEHVKQANRYGFRIPAGLVRMLAKQGVKKPGAGPDKAGTADPDPADTGHDDDDGDLTP